MAHHSQTGLTKKLTILTFVFALLLSQGCATVDEKAWRKSDPASLGYSETSLADLDHFINDNANTTGLIIVANGSVIHEYGDVRKLSYIASVRKSVLSLLYGIYVERGKINLNKSLAELKIDDIEGLSDLEMTATIEDVITSRSGVYHPASNPGDSLACAPERGSQLPGSYFLYSNWDFNVAGAIFEQETGVNIFDALLKELAIPLGMQDFKRSIHKKSGNLNKSMYPSYHMVLSTRDMARIGQLVAQKGRWEQTQIVPEAWVDKISTVVTPVNHLNPGNRRTGPFGFSYMWWVWDGPSATGAYEGAYTAQGAYGQYITVLPKLDLVVAHKTHPKSGHTGRKMYLEILSRIVASKI